MDAAHAGRVDDDGADGDGREEIHRLIAVLKALGEWRGDIGTSRVEHGAERRDERARNQYDEEDEEKRRQHFANAVHELARIQREVVGSAEEQRRVDGLPERDGARIEERADADLE